MSLDQVQAEGTSAWDYALRCETDPAAPVTASGTILIDRPPGVVWSMLGDVTTWPSIRADVQDVKAEEGLTSGARFSWVAGGVPVQSRFAMVDAGRCLSWTTEAPGLEVVHVYCFEALGEQATRLRASESMAGELVAKAQIGNVELSGRIASWLEGIKTLAESS